MAKHKNMDFIIDRTYYAVENIPNNDYEAKCYRCGKMYNGPTVGLGHDQLQDGTVHTYVCPKCFEILLPKVLGAMQRRMNKVKNIPNRIKLARLYGG